MKQTVRTFIAVEIEEPVRDRAQGLIETFRQVPADVKWVEWQNLHLTLKFLGEVPLMETAEIIRAVARAAAEVPPFELEIRGAGAFPNLDRPRTVWLGANEGGDAMSDLAVRIERALKKLGYPPEGRKFKPHLTIGRVRGGGPELAQLGRLLAEHADDDLGRSSVEEVLVFGSHLGPGGSTYEVLGHAALGSAAGGRP
jgi:RNA 2',3'-cyclic 3'-phosphodiesterase